LSRLLFFVAGFLGFLGLVLDAYGAHGLEKALAGRPVADIAEALNRWQTAVRYQLGHAVLIALFAIIAHFQNNWTLKLGSACAFLGIILFSGSLYMRVLYDVSWVTRFAPYGGVLLMTAWLCLAFRG